MTRLTNEKRDTLSNTLIERLIDKEYVEQIATEFLAVFKKEFESFVFLKSKFTVQELREEYDKIQRSIVKFNKLGPSIFLNSSGNYAEHFSFSNITEHPVKRENLFSEFPTLCECFFERRDYSFIQRILRQMSPILEMNYHSYSYNSFTVIHPEEYRFLGSGCGLWEDFYKVVKSNKNHPLRIAYCNLVNQIILLTKDAEKTIGQINETLSSVNTVKKLIEAWPDIEEIVPEDWLVKPKKQLPSIPVKSLNSALGLPSEKKST